MCTDRLGGVVQGRVRRMRAQIVTHLVDLEVLRVDDAWAADMHT